MGGARPFAGTTPRERQTRMRALPKIRAVLWILSYEAKEAVLFVGDSSGEKNSSSLRREHIPQAIELQRRSISAHQCLDERARHRIVDVNESVTEIAYPKVAFHHSESPWRIEIPVGDQASEEVAAGIEHIHEATAGTVNVIYPSMILLGVGHKNFAVEIPDAERGVTSRKIRIDKAVGSHLMKVLIVGLNVACMKICYIQEVVTIGHAERCAFINGVVNAMVRAVIDGDDGVRQVQRRVPP